MAPASPSAKRPALILILGDQLSHNLSVLRQADPSNTVILMAEVMTEATYVRHHKKKIAFLFSAMRHFAEELRSAGWVVDYVKLDDADNSSSLFSEVQRACARHDCHSVSVTAPGEWRLLQDMQSWPNTKICDDDRFIASRREFEDWADGRKTMRMEYFYRDMRRKTGLLMEGDRPIGGQWNFDHDNRKAAKRDLLIPQPMRFAPDTITSEVITLVKDHFPDHFGSLTPFWFGSTRGEAALAFAHFVQTTLPHFGDYQDAMLSGEPFLYHSVISLYLNCGLLDPLEMCRTVDAAYQKGHVPLNAAEGFIRQIIGWREYVRGIYWLKMPDYRETNALCANRPLPGFYWTADTDMACMRACIAQTRDEAYAHHIQRLMVTGNFALLAGIDPHALHEWYLAVYADAYEWVELPNTMGMSQYADGGLLASKPYAASGAYIDRMSDYCGGCHYKVKVKSGPFACPFNLLYWDFIGRHAERFRRNPRMAQMVRLWDQFDGIRKDGIKADAGAFLARAVPQTQQ